jgi:hypothetical protein
LAVLFTIRLQGRSLVVHSERAAVLLLETNSRASRKFNNSKNRLTDKVLSYNVRERSFRE